MHDVKSFISIVPVVGDCNDDQKVENSGEQRHEAWHDVNEHSLKVTVL